MIFLFFTFLFAIDIKVDMSRATPEMKAWLEVQAAYNLTSQLIIDDLVSQAQKSAAHGVEVMKNLEKMKDSELTPQDLKQAREIASALERFLKSGKRLDQPGSSPDYYLDAIKGKLFFKHPSGVFEGIPFEELDKFIKNLQSPMMQNLNCAGLCAC